jgi:hypothetical protein
LVIRHLRATLSVALACSIAQTHLVPPARAQAPPAPPAGSAQQQPGAVSHEDYEACQAGDDRAFRASVEKITITATEKGLQGLDYAAAVDIEWRKIGMDQILDKRVDIAVEEVQNETSLGTRIQSLGNKEKAQELATAVAERVYRSEAVSGAIEKLAEGVGQAVGTRIELASQDAAGPALDCLRAFLGTRYGQTVAGVVSANAADEFGLDPAKGGAGVNAGAVLKQTTGGITGAAILIVRRQLANMARRIGQRIVGAVLSRLVSVVAGGIGLVLIAKDIWDLRNGVLPIISDEMKATATKALVKQELATSLSQQIGEHVREIGAKSAERVVEIWHEFRRAHLKALELAERHDGFRKFLGDVQPAAFARLDEITGLVLSTEGEAGILKRLQDGTLETAVHRLPEPAMTIAREIRSVEPALAWTAVAGDSLDKVVAYEVYRTGKPEAFTQVSLGRLFAVDDRLAVSRLSALDRSARDSLFELNPVDLKSLARALSEGELTTLAAYLTGLQSAPRDRVLKAVAADPTAMRRISHPRLRNAILASADQNAAVEMFLRSRDADTAQATARDFMRAWEGDISPWLLWERHPLPTLAIAFGALLLLLLLRRLLFPRRHRPPPAPPGQATPAAV